MNEITNSTLSINGFYYDFTGVKAKLNSSMRIISVIDIKSGEDRTEEFKDRYDQKVKLSASQYDMMRNLGLDMSGFKRGDS